MLRSCKTLNLKFMAVPLKIERPHVQDLIHTSTATQFSPGYANFNFSHPRSYHQIDVWVDVRYLSNQPNRMWTSLELMILIAFNAE